MMLVQILNFGSNWWARFGSDPADRCRFGRRAAYFDSTGLRFGNKIRRHWIVPGLIRFNGVADFNPQFPYRFVGAVFECTDLIFAFGGSRVLFQRRAAHSVPPDYFLAVFSDDQFGKPDCQRSDWKAASVLPIAVSESREKQEAMLLMKPLDWVRTTLGVWQLKTGLAPQSARLELLEEGVLE
jgi:hypothetical protein